MTLNNKALFEDTQGSKFGSAKFAERVHFNQRKLSCDLKPQYDFIVAGPVRPARRVAGRPAGLAKQSASRRPYRSRK